MRSWLPTAALPTMALMLLLAGIGCPRALAQEALNHSMDRSAPPIDIYALFRVVGNLYDLDPGLLRAIASVESGYNPEAISPKGARGLMQLMPETAKRFRVDNSFDPVENALGAARFLEHLKISLGAAPGSAGSLACLLAAYNAGEAAVTQYRGIPPFPETQEYVRRVLFTYLTDGLSPQLKAKLIRAQNRRAIEPSPGKRPADPRVDPPVDPRVDPMDQLAELRAGREAALRHSPGTAQAAETR
jgi:hypothetical protein